jgi:hypothetical protein
MADMTRVEAIRRAERLKDIRALEAKRDAALVEDPTAMGGDVRKFSPEEEAYIERSSRNYGMGSKFADEATFGLLKKAGAATQAALGMDSTGGVLNYDNDFSDRYGNLLDVEKEVKRRYEDENPIKSGVAGVAGIGYGVGGLMKGGVTATKLIPETIKGIPKAIAGITAGATDAAAIGGVSAFGEDRDVASEAGTSALIGGGITTAMTALPPALRFGLDKIFKSETGKSALEKVVGHVPPNLTAKAGSLMQHAYQKVLGVAYGGGGQVYAQGRKAIDAFVRKHRKELNVWSQKMFNRAAPEGYKITRGGHRGAVQLKDAVTKAYDKAWNGATMSAGGRETLAATADDITKTASTANKDRLKGFSKDLKNPALTAQDLDKTLRTELKSAGAQGDAKAVEQIKALREDLRGLIPPANNTALGKVDDIYPNYLTVTDATGRKASLLTQGKPTADTLLDASAKVGKGEASFGMSPLQKSIAKRAIKDREFGKYIKWLEERLPDKSPAMWQRGIANAGIGSTLGSGLGLATGGAAGALLGAVNPVTHALSVPIAAAAARPGVQKMLSGSKIFDKQTADMAAALRRSAGMGTGAAYEE